MELALNEVKIENFISQTFDKIVEEAREEITKE